MLAILIYIVAAVCVVVIGLVTVGRETFAASLVPRPAVYQIDDAAVFVAEGLDDRTAGRLTPDDVLWILTIDGARLGMSDDDPGAPGAQVFDDQVAVAQIMAKVSADAKRARTIDAADVAAVIAGRTRYLERIGAIGSAAPDIADDIPVDIPVDIPEDIAVDIAADDA